MDLLSGIFVFMAKIISNSAEETKQIAFKLAKKMLNGGIIALSGNLGAGKTTFAQGFAEGLGIKDKIISPTFILIRQHQIPNSKNIFFHIDLYRLEEDTTKLGLEEIFLSTNNITLIEWAEKLNHLPENVIKISIKNLGYDKREITLP